jgi:hypothetical protein
MNVSSDALNKRRTTMSTQETTTKTETANPKKAKASKKPAKARKAATSKKTAKATKAKSAAKAGSKAAIVLDLMKRKEGATLAEIAQSNRLAEPQHSRVRQWSRYEEAGAQGRVDQERGRGNELTESSRSSTSRARQERP